MAADCWFCRKAVPAVRNTLGMLGNPLGLCVKCNSLCCGHHGHRSGSPAFLCIVCDSSLQSASAAWKAWVNSGGLTTLRFGAVAPVFQGDPAGSRLAAALVSLFPPGSRLASELVDSLDEWRRSRSGYGLLAEVIGQLAERLMEMLDAQALTEQQAPGWPPDDEPRPAAGADFGPGEVAAFWRSLDLEGRRLVAAAIVLIRLLQVDLADLPAPLRAVARFAEPIETEWLNGWRAELLERIGDG